MRRWFLVWLAYLSLFAFGFVDSARGPVYPDLLKDLHLSDTAGAWFFFSASAAALVNNLLLFNWIERIGPHRTTQVYSLVQALGLALIGLSPTYAGTLCGSAILGASLGGLGISSNVLVAEGAAKRFRRQALAGLHCMYGVSSLLAPLLVTWLYHLGLDWRRALGSLTVAPLVVFAASFFGDEISALPVTDGRLLGDAPGILSPAAPARNEEVAPRNLGRAFFFALVCSLYVVAEIAIGTRLALFARREWGYSLESANDLVSGFFLGLFLGRLAFAVLPIKVSSRAILLGSLALSLVCFSLGLLLAPIWLAWAGLMMSVFYPCMISFINELFGKNGSEACGDAKYITSWCITLQSLGTLAFHFSVGELSDRVGLRAALWIGPCALVLALSLLGVFYLGKPARQS